MGHSEEAGGWVITLLLKLSCPTQKQQKQFKFHSWKVEFSTSLRWPTNELPECELQFSLIRWVASHEFCFDFQIFQFQIEDLLLQGLLKPGAPLLIWAQVRNREAESEAEHWSLYSQRHVTVAGSVTVIQKNLREGLMLWIEFEETFRLQKALEKFMFRFTFFHFKEEICIRPSIHPYQADMFIIRCVQMGRHQLCGGQLLGLEQGVETVYNTNVQLASHRAQLHLDFCFPGNGAEPELAALEKRINDWVDVLNRTLIFLPLLLCVVATRWAE